MNPTKPKINKILLSIFILVLATGGVYWFMQYHKTKTAVMPIQAVASEEEKTQLVSDLNVIYGKDNFSVELIKGNFATGGTGALDEGYDAGYIAVKKDGHWSILASFQDDLSCQFLRENNVPVEIYKTCYEEKYGNPWEGKWSTTGNTFYGGDLTITNVTPSRFDFEIFANRGANTGVIGDLENTDSKATATIKGNSAVFKEAKDSDGDPCTLTLSLNKDVITITDLDYRCARAYGGIGVGFDGTYVRNGKPKATILDEDDLFKKYPNSYEAFKKLVGLYGENFEATAMQHGGEDDLDKELNAEVRIYWVSGLANYNTSIVILAPGNKIWAAAPDLVYPPSERGATVDISYFTNVPGWENKLPESIKEWKAATGHKNATVIYRNKK